MDIVEDENILFRQQQQEYADALTSMYNSTLNNMDESSSNSTTLFVGDLSVVCQEHHLIELFAGYIDKEHVTAAHILRCRTTGTSLCYGFVTITSPNCEEEARLIRNELHGMYFFGRVLKLRNAKTDGISGNMDNNTISDLKGDGNLYNYDLPKISLYVKFQCTNVSNNNHVNEESIREIFELDSDTKRKIYDDAGSNESNAYSNNHNNTNTNDVHSSEVDDNTNNNTNNKKNEFLNNDSEFSNAIVDVSIRKLAVDRVSYMYIISILILKYIITNIYM